MAAFPQLLALVVIASAAGPATAGTILAREPVVARKPNPRRDALDARIKVLHAQFLENCATARAADLPRLRETVKSILAVLRERTPQANPSERRFVL